MTVIPYIEYFQQEDGHELKPADFAKFNPGFIPDDKFREMHAAMPLVCHDAIVNYRGGALLAVRTGIPAQGVLSPLGGRLKKGIQLEESLRKVIKRESGLELEGLRNLGITRVVWEKDPFGHGRGTDAFTFMYYARGVGELKLDDTLNKSLLLFPSDYTATFRQSLHPYTRDFLDVVIPIIVHEK